MTYKKVSHQTLNCSLTIHHYFPQSMRNELNDDLVKISNWEYQWKMSFNPDPSKQAQEVIFSRKTKKLNHPPLTFSKSTVSQSTYQKHLGVILDASQSFKEHLINVQSKTNKIIGLLCKLHNTLPRQSLITIYKAFVRPRLWWYSLWPSP